MEKQRIVVGLSGGVDSAVTAHLLKQQGHEVVGIFMKNWEDDDDSEYCASNVDFIDAAAVADVLGIEIEHVNFAVDYKDRVFAEFLREYQAGRTPNPDVLCNAEIKFKAFLDHAIRLGAEKIATGHYARARVDAASGRHELLKGLDPAKDQSYFLHRLNQAQLSRTLFPLGELHKTEVRRIAEEIGLPNAKKRDSTGICFIGERPFREFLNRYISKEPGPVKDDRGRRIGEHQGLSFYTLGQRQGLGIGGIKQPGRAAWRRRPLRRGSWRARTSRAIPSGPCRATIIPGCCRPPWWPTTRVGWPVRRPHRRQPMPPSRATARATRIAYSKKTLTVPQPAFGSISSEPQWAVTPGQSAVLVRRRRVSGRRGHRAAAG